MTQEHDDVFATIQPPEPDQLTYGTYLKVDELLQLQDQQGEPPMHDELLFITIHQAYELWFKQILFELAEVEQRLTVGDIYEAHRLMMRVIAIEKLLVQQIHILETMAPRDFASFRTLLKPASGFQSIQFREVEFTTGIRDRRVLRGLRLSDSERERLEARITRPSLRTIFFEALQRRGWDVVIPPEEGELEGEERMKTLLALVPMYQNPERHLHLYNLCEAFVEHDQCLLLWRFHHVRVVERLIGTKMGTGGSPGVRYLNSTLEKRAFNILWEVRAQLDDEALFGKPRGITEG
jgi:tryptophan 2,3-dioxygenase